MTANDRSPSSRRLFVTDRYSNQTFLVDTGSDICCYPKKFFKKACPATTYQLSAANGTIINTYGTTYLCLNLGLCRDYRWNFIVADVECAIIGSDFLALYNLLPDCTHSTLVDGTTRLSA